MPQKRRSVCLPLLDSMGFHDYQMIDGEKLYIYERLEDAPLVNQMLVQHGIFVKSVSVTRGDLENYFYQNDRGRQTNDECD